MRCRGTLNTMNLESRNNISSRYSSLHILRKLKQCNLCFSNQNSRKGHGQSGHGKRFLTKKNKKSLRMDNKAFRKITGKSSLLRSYSASSSQKSMFCASELNLDCLLKWPLGNQCVLAWLWNSGLLFKWNISLIRLANQRWFSCFYTLSSQLCRKFGVGKPRSRSSSAVARGSLSGSINHRAAVLQLITSHPS